MRSASTPTELAEMVRACDRASALRGGSWIGVRESERAGARERAALGGARPRGGRRPGALARGPGLQAARHRDPALRGRPDDRQARPPRPGRGHGARRIRPRVATGPRMLLVLHGVKRNAGDFLIRERGLEILRHLRPAQRLVVHPRWEPVDRGLFDSADAVVLCGGPGLARRFYPRVFAMVDDLDAHPTPVLPVALGWSGTPAEDPERFKFSRKSIAALRAIHARIGWSGVRDELSLEIVRRADVGEVAQNGLLCLVPPAEHGPVPALRGARASAGVHARGAAPAAGPARGRFPAPPPPPTLPTGGALLRLPARASGGVRDRDPDAGAPGNRGARSGARLPRGGCEPRPRRARVVRPGRPARRLPRPRPPRRAQPAPPEPADRRGRPRPRPGGHAGGPARPPRGRRRSGRRRRRRARSGGGKPMGGERAGRRGDRAHLADRCARPSSSFHPARAD